MQKPFDVFTNREDLYSTFTKPIPLQAQNGKHSIYDVTSLYDQVELT